MYFINLKKKEGNTMKQKKFMSIFFWVFFLLSLSPLMSPGKVHSSEVTGDIFQIEWKLNAKGKSEKLEITIFPKGDIHCNLEYPWKISVTDASKIQFSKDRYSKEDATIFSNAKVQFNLPILKRKKGGKSTLEIKFSMCNSTQCFMKKVPIEYIASY